VVFTSDHGYFYGEHGLNEERRLAYEETIRIPLIVRFPRLARAGTTPAEMALSIDLAPTLLSLMGVDAKHPMPGRDLTREPDDLPGRAMMQYEQNYAWMEDDQVSH
jgi:N-acetylglucosamine-6-sulfatase